MASIRKRVQKNGAVSLAVLWRDPETGKQTSVTVATMDAAETLKRLLDANGQSFSAAERILESNARKTPLVIDMLDKHLQLLTKPSAGTIAGYRSIIEHHLKDSLGALPVDVVNEEHLASWIKAEVAAGMSRKTIANAIGLLSSAFKMAVRKNWRGDNPCELVSLPNEQRGGRRATFLTRDEYTLLAEHLPERHRLLAEFLVSTGLRFSEATALTWEDLDLTGRVPLVRVDKAWKRDERRGFFLGSTKSSPSDREVSLPLDLVEKLAKAPRPHALVFPNQSGHQLRTSTFHQHGWQHAVRDAGKAGLTKKPRPHDLRHTHASWLLNAGVSIYVVSRRLGHADIGITTSVYGHIMPAAFQEAATVTNSLMRGDAS
ncbi:tyrosine-type recombinase/integrase [Mycetocola saprophilus]|uniref:tyrosine-type recombinase/integrase n=1 Tax=Mycetocola saprophilus TaxID=76636 RepID=UPI00138E2937|nr:site-specific integrase [Mycetocola saprophilus]